MNEKILVLVVDRDDDIGRKTPYRSPIIGRDNILSVAQTFALSDPEDSDLNTIYAAIKLFDQLREEGKDVEIAIICGNESADRSADEKIERELQEVLRVTKATGVYLVTDGAEDEYVVPIITSYVPIKSIQRIVIKQVPKIETTYYVIKKLLEDEKIQRKFVLPLSIFFLVYGILMLVGKSSYALAASLLIISAYAIIKIYKLESHLIRFVNITREKITSGSIQPIFNTVALVIAIGGILQSIGVAINLSPTTTAPLSRYVPIVIGIKNAAWWIYLSYLIIFIGRFLESIMLNKKIVLTAQMHSFSTSLVLVLIVLALLSATEIALATSPEDAVIAAVTSRDFIVYLVLAVLILSIRYVLETLITRGKETA